MALSLKEFVGNLLGQQIDDWDATLKELLPEGGLDAKAIQMIIIELCKRVEKLESV